MTGICSIVYKRVALFSSFRVVFPVHHSLTPRSKPKHLHSHFIITSYHNHQDEDLHHCSYRRYCLLLTSKIPSHHCSFNGLTVSQALAVPFDFEDPLQGRDIFTPEWEVEVKPGGDTVVLNGTIQEVHTQLLELNPNWDTDFKDDGLDKREADFGDWADDTAGLDKRANFNGASYNCWGRWGAVSREHIQSGINYLRRVRGKPRAGAGPSKCGRVSCSYNSAIYWCNDVSD